MWHRVLRVGSSSWHTSVRYTRTLRRIFFCVFREYVVHTALQLALQQRADRVKCPLPWV